ncbi:Radical SAM superfamily protein [Lutibacter oricola]|uniref:Radical SAM superfamily protein n=1 Tax=Lutibacter oricola TaxID=762486 RepID=A0A1H3E070_9FLAO|nr:radical SAM protein [Lutibacter oricola]SDX72066.1 Radical SAM superfamily protein [Lutibacter oricola]
MSRKKHCNIPIFIPELACPHQCVFCNQEKISNTLSIPSAKEIKTLIDNYLETISEGTEINIAFFGGSFTGIPKDEMIGYLKIAYKYVKEGKVQGIRISTKPDYITNPILDTLEKYGVTAIELGAQSTNNKVLVKSGRGHKFDAIEKASKLIKQRNFELGLQMMLGLPHDTLNLSIQTAKDIVRLKADTTRIYPTLVVKDTVLEKMYNRGDYKVLSMDEAIVWSKEALKIFTKANIKVLRVGLHPSEELEPGKSLIAGPIHPSFKEMVLSALWKDYLHEKLIPKGKSIIKVAQNQLNYAIGYKGINRKYLLENGCDVKFVSDATLTNFEFNVCNN